MHKYFGLAFALVVLFAGSASAHVTLDPREVVVGRNTLSLRVPNEKDIPTVEVRLVVPEGMEVTSIVPTAGWTHSEKRGPSDPNKTEEDGHPSPGPITEITWSGGRVNVGELVLFGIGTRYEGDPKAFSWKAYQKYSDGTVVPWDDSNEEAPGPKLTFLKESKLDTVTNTVNEVKAQAEKSAQTSLWIALASLLVAIASMLTNLKRTKR